MGIRDHWDNKDGSLQKSFEALKNAVGYSIMVQPEWQMLIAELDAQYPDKEILVANTARYTDLWCMSLLSILSDGDAWAESLSERLKGRRRVVLLLNVWCPVPLSLTKLCSLVLPRYQGRSRPRQPGIRRRKVSCSIFPGWGGHKIAQSSA